MTNTPDRQANRAEALLHEDLIVPVHHHDDRRSTLFANLDGHLRPVTPDQAAALVAEHAPTPELTDVDHVADGPVRVRRRHLLGGVAAGFGGLLASSVAPRYSFAAPVAGSSSARPLLVVVFCRGGLDGLSAVAPTADPAYRKARPLLGLRPEHVLPLSGGWGLNRSMAALKPLWDARELAIVHGAGHRALTRSHFDDEIRVELAAEPSMRSGWLGRHLQSSSTAQGTFRAITLGHRAALSLSTTAFDTLAISSVAGFGLNQWAGRDAQAQVEGVLAGMYAASGGQAAEQAGAVFGAVRELASERSRGQTNTDGYPAGDFGRGLAEIARLGRSGAGVEVACIDLPNWDLHAGHGRAGDANGPFAQRSRMLAEGIASLRRGLGSHWSRTTVVTMSEFGRRVTENGSGGTDHGRGNVMFIAGGGIKGGRLHHRIAGLGPDALVDGQDVPVGIDYRQPLAEIVSARLGNRRLDQVFPGFGALSPLGIA
ncbi:MAG: DUF1501 domain-containing protein [Propionibacteriaceae bacterium]|nr:DUF1501 domain-containing protein [Propionibacteriaceae bacterium]